MGEDVLKTAIPMLQGDTTGLLPALVAKLLDLATALGKTLTITSGLRTLGHNEAVGGAANTPIYQNGVLVRTDPDQHTVGKAADVWWEGFNQDDAQKYGRAVGFTGIGVYLNHAHFDIRDGDRYEWTSEKP